MLNFPLLIINEIQKVNIVDPVKAQNVFIEDKNRKLYFFYLRKSF